MCYEQMVSVELSAQQHCLMVMDVVLGKVLAGAADSASCLMIWWWYWWLHCDLVFCTGNVCNRIFLICLRSPQTDHSRVGQQLDTVMPSLMAITVLPSSDNHHKECQCSSTR
jgi:hypothetical protein